MEERNFDWIKTNKYAWMQGVVMFPVKVEILQFDFASQTAMIKTDYQQGEVDFSRLYPSEMSCDTL